MANTHNRLFYMGLGFAAILYCTNLMHHICCMSDKQSTASRNTVPICWFCDAQGLPIGGIAKTEQSQLLRHGVTARFLLLLLISVIGEPCEC